MPVQQKAHARSTRIAIASALTLVTACAGDSTKKPVEMPGSTAGMGAQVPSAINQTGGTQAVAMSASGSGGQASSSPAPVVHDATAGGAGGSMHAASNPQPDAGAMPPAIDAGASHTVATLFWLDLLGNAVMRAGADGADAHAIASGGAIATPDGVAVDLDASGGHVYWTNMGSPLGGANNGTLQRAQLDGSNVEGIVPAGAINTPKQMTIDHEHGKLYFCDREGAKVWRANLDGSQLETLASDHDFVELVGIALDVPKAQFYFTDRMAKKIRRASFDMPAGETAANRSDIEELISIGGNAMPIDLDVDLGRRQIYWTDRVLGTVQRAGMDLPAGQTPGARTDIETLVMGVTDAIGISLDLAADVFYFGQLNGALWRVKRDGSGQQMVASSGSVSGVALAHLPSM